MTVRAALSRQSLLPRRAQQVPGRGRRRRPRRRMPRRTRCSAATARRWPWTWRASARPTPQRCCWSAAPATASRASAARACRSRCSTTRRSMRRPRDAGVAVLYVHALNPYGFSWWRRTTHENVDLNRNFHDFASRCRPTRATTRSRRCSCPPTWPPSPEVAGLTAALHRAARRARAAGRDLRRPAQPPAGPVLRRREPDLEPRRRCARCCASTATRCARLGWIDLHTGLGPSGHGERIFACRDDAAALARARAWWGEEVTVDLRRQLDLGAADRADVAGRLRGMPAGRVHRHRAGVRHVPLMEVMQCAARRPVAGEPPGSRRRRSAARSSGSMRDAFYTDTDAVARAHPGAGPGSGAAGRRGHVARLMPPFRGKPP